MAALNTRNSQTRTLGPFLHALYHDERGASLAEYAMLLAVLSVLLVGTIQAFSTEIAAVFQATADGWASLK